MARGVENLDKLRGELDLLQSKLEQLDFEDTNYDVIVARIGDIQKILNADTEAKERKRERVGKIIGGVARVFITGGLYIVGMQIVTKAEEERPLLSKVLNAPQNILKL